MEGYDRDTHIDCRHRPFGSPPAVAIPRGRRNGGHRCRKQPAGRGNGTPCGRAWSRPLEEILKEVRKIIVGDIVEIEFEKHDGRYIYEIEYVAPNGHLMDIKIDAKTLAVLSHDQEDED
ncbi:MAG: PepSY domain-containing protein [Rhizobium sp.]|nr:PepSY domain-containing protein [Rhizobium sp.]